MSELLIHFREWSAWVAEWLIVILILRSIWYEKETLRMIIKEYEYDEQKDIEKKHRRTKTTKKTTQKPGGESVVEESTEISEPMEEKK